MSITHDGLLIMYGGELEPRKPVDTGADEISQALPGSLHTFNLKGNSQSISKPWTTLSPHIQPSIPNSMTFPEPRVGTITVWDKLTNSLYLWGGRGGASMAPLDRASAGPWKARLSLEGVEWQRLVAINEDESPEPRSYHGAVLFEGKLYIHAGCPESGRLSTLHSFDLSSNRWKSLASAPDPGRGGTGLAAVQMPDQGGTILRFGGFAGYELGADHVLDIYNIASDSWRSVVPAADPIHGYPGPRSVHGFVPCQPTSSSPAIAVLYHGEREPSSVGHAGAGTFWDDVWLLDYFHSKTPGEFQWRKAVAAEDGEHPEGRGWFPGASYVDEHGYTKVAMFGGLLTSNARSEELWVLEID